MEGASKPSTRTRLGYMRYVKRDHSSYAHMLVVLHGDDGSLGGNVLDSSASEDLLGQGLAFLLHRLAGVLHLSTRA